MKRGTRTLFPVGGALALALMLLPGASFAAPLYSGTITGIFSSPVLSGVNINTDGTTASLDNTLTAIHSGAGTGRIAWGACDSSCGAGPYESAIAFTGESFFDVAPDTLFRLGTLNFQNGSSFSTSLIFGATLTIGVAGSPFAIDAAVALVGVLPTVNGGLDPHADADFLRFDALPVSFHVFEGATGAVDVYGYIHGDARVVLGELRLPPGQAGNGFLLPEPGNLALLGLGLAVLGMTRRRRE